MINKKIILLIGAVLLIGGIVYASSVVFSNSKGLIAHWPLDAEHYDSISERVTDVTPYENHGTNDGSILATDHFGNSNRAMYFDGSNDYIDLVGEDIDLSTTDFTISVWFRRLETDDYHFIYDKRDATSDGFVFGVWNNPTGNTVNKLAGWVNGISVLSDTLITDGEWHHGVFVADRDGNGQIYLDGVADGSAVSISGQTISVTPNARISKRSFGVDEHFWNGSLEDLRIYNYALSINEISTLYNSYRPKSSSTSLYKGLVGHWMLDSEGYNSVTERITDKTPYENHGVNSGASLTTDRFGNSNRAMSFDGVSDYINVSDSIDPSGATEYSILAWVKSTSGATNDAIVGWWDGSNGIFIQSETPTLGNEGLLVVAGDGTDYGYVDFETSDNFVHVALVYDGSLSGDANRLKLYVNGNNQTLTFHASANILASIPSLSSTNLGIGDVGGLNRFWNGSISDVRIYNRALSANEISKLYDSYRPKAASGSLMKGLILDMPLKSKYMRSSTVLTDRTPYNNHGTNNGATVGGSYTDFDGSSNKIEIIDDSSLEPSGAVMSISFWMNAREANDSIIFKRIASGEYAQYSISSNIGNIYWLQSQSSGTWHTNANTAYPSFNTWHHIVGTNNGSTAKLYIDSVEVANDTSPATSLAASLQPLGIGWGRVAAANTYFNGSISDVKIYNRALTTPEIELLYDKGR